MKTKAVEYLSENMDRNIKYRGGGFEYIQGVFYKRKKRSFGAGRYNCTGS